MADATRKVSIDIQVTGADPKSLDAIRGAFVELKGNVDLIVGNLSTFTGALEKLKVPQGFSEFTLALKELSKVDGKNIQQTAEGLKVLSTVKDTKVPNLDKFVTELKKLSEITLPNVNGVAKGIALLTKDTTDVDVAAAKLNQLKTSLEQFKGISAPNLKQLTDGLNALIGDKSKGISSINTGAVNAKITSLATSLNNLSGIKPPSLSGFVKSINELSAFTATGKIKDNVTELGNALRGFGEVKIPPISGFVSGLKKFLEVDPEKIAAKIKNLNDVLLELDKNGNLKSISSLARDLGTMSAAIDKAGVNLKQMTKATKESEDGFAKLREKITTAATYMALYGVMSKLKDSFSNGVEAIVDYSQGLKDLQAITLATDSEVAQMGNTILSVAESTKFSASQVAQGMTILGQAGFSASEAINSMQAIANLATGTLSDLPTVVDLISTSLRVFNIDAANAAKVSDILANAVNKSKLDVDKLRTALNYVGPIANDAGISLAETATAMGMLANSGLKASTIGTSLREVFSELEMAPKAMAEAAAKVGLTMDDLDPKTQGLSKVVKNLQLMLTDTSVAFDLFGKRGAAGALALVSATNNFDTMFAEINRSGTAAEMAAIQMEGLGVSWKNLKDKAGVLAVAIGKGGLEGAMSGLINVVKYLLDGLITLAESGIGKVVIGLGLAVAAVGSYMVALKAVQLLKSYETFKVLASGLTELPALFKAASLAVKELTVTMGIFQTVSGGGLLVILGVLITALTALEVHFLSTGKAARESAQQALQSADEYDVLTKKFAEYLKETSTLKAGSEGMKVANLSLRDSLIEVSNSMSPIADKAAEAAASISAIDGSFINGEKAVKDYNIALNKLKFDELVKATQAANKNLEDSTSGFTTKINTVIDFSKLAFKFYEGEVKAILSLTDGNMQKSGDLVKRTATDVTNYFKGWSKASDISKMLSDNTLKFQEFSDYVDNLDKTDHLSHLTAQEKDLVVAFNLLSETAQKALKPLLESGQIQMTDSTESVRMLGEKAGITGKALDDMVSAFERMQKINLAESRGLVEKWRKEFEDGTVSVLDQVDALKTLGVKIDENSLKEIQGMEDYKRFAVERLKLINQTYDTDIAKGMSVYDAEKKRQAAIILLGEEAAAKQVTLADNEIRIKANSLGQIEKDYQDHMKRIQALRDIGGADNVRAAAKEAAEAEAARRNAIAKLTSGGNTTAKQALEDSKNDVAELKATYEDMYLQLQIQVNNGVKSQAQADAEKRQLQMQLATQILDIWNNTNEKLIASNQNHGKEYKKVQSEIIAATFETSKVRLDVEKDLKKELDLEKGYLNDLNQLKDSSNKKASEARNTYNNAIRNGEQALAKKIYDINVELGKKLNDINKERVANAKTTQANIASITDSFAEKYRKIAQKTMSPAQIEADNTETAYNRIKEAAYTLKEALDQNDLEKLKRGQEMLNQAASLADGIADQTTQTDLLQKAEAGLKDAAGYEGQLKDLELIRKKNEAIAEAVRKQQEAQNDLKTIKSNAEEALKTSLSNIDTEKLAKFKSLTETYEKAKGNEVDLQTIKMSNLDKEIAKQQQIIDMTKTRIALEHGGEMPKDALSTGSGTIGNLPNKGTSQTQSEIKKTAEVAITANNEIIASNTQVESSGVKTYTNIAQSSATAAASSKNDLQTVKDTYVNLKTAIRDGGVIYTGKPDPKTIEDAQKLAGTYKGIGTEVDNLNSKQISVGPSQEMIQGMELTKNGLLIIKQNESAVGNLILERIKQTGEASAVATQKVLADNATIQKEAKKSAEYIVDAVTGELVAVQTISDQGVKSWTNNKEAIAQFQAQLKEAMSSNNEITLDITPINAQLGDVEDLIDRTLGKFKEPIPFTITTEQTDEQLNAIFDFIRSGKEEIATPTELAISTEEATKVLDASLIEMQQINDAVTDPKTLAIETDKASVEQVKGVKATLEDVFKLPTDYDLHVKVTGVDVVRNLIDMISGLKDKTINIITNYISKGVKAAGFANGGLIQEYADGGNVFRRLSSPKITQGSGTKDDVPALLMQGEFVMKKKAVEKYGTDFMYALNNGLLNLGNGVRKFKNGGAVDALNNTAFNVGRSAQLAISPNSPLTHGGVTYNISSPTFHSHLSKSATNFKSGGGKAIANALISKFASIVPQLQSGGNIGGGFAYEQGLINSEYAQLIQQAAENGDLEKAYALEQEKLQLEMLAAELEFTLKQLQMDLENAKEEAAIELETGKEEIQALKDDAAGEYADAMSDLESSRSDIENDFLKQKTDLTRLIEDATAQLNRRLALKAQLQNITHSTSSSPDPLQDSLQQKVDRAQQDMENATVIHDRNDANINRKEETAQSKYDRKMATADRKLPLLERRYTFAVDKADKTFAFSSEKETKMEKMAEAKEIMTANHDVAKIDLDTKHEIAKLQIELVKQLNELRKQYASQAASSDSGISVTHWLNSGGPVRFTKGAKRHEDSVGAVLTPGEYVLSEEAVNHYGERFISALNNREVGATPAHFANGGFVGQMPLMINDTQFHVNAGSFHNNLSRRVSTASQTTFGAKTSKKLVDLFTLAVPKLASGGSATDSMSQLGAEKQNLMDQYAELIQYAKESGQQELQFILESESLEIEQLANELIWTLQELQIERDNIIQQAELDLVSGLEDLKTKADDIETTYQSSLYDAKDDLQAKKDDAEKQKLYAFDGVLKVRDEFNKWAMNFGNEVVGKGSGGFGENNHYMPTIGELNPNLPLPLFPYSPARSLINAMMSGGVTIRKKNEDGFDKRYFTDEVTGKLMLERLEQYKNNWDNSALGINIPIEQFSKYQDKYDSVIVPNIEKKHKTSLENWAAEKLSLESKIKFTEDNAKKTFDFKTEHESKKNEIVVKQAHAKASNDYKKTEMSMNHEIARLEIELRKELLALEKSYASSQSTTSAQQDLSVKHWLNAGGHVGRNQGIPGKDSIRAMLTPGEYVIQEPVVSKFGKGFFDMLNKMQLPSLKFADGGLVPGASLTNSLSDSLAYNGKVDFVLGGKQFSMRSSASNAQALVNEITRLKRSVA